QKFGVLTRGEVSLSSRYPLWGAAREAYETAGGCAKRSRASTANSEVTGQGVAPFGSNKRPC
ncbi:MAG: hypothetical protein LBD24_00695, partial [Spirochaetaceae bacterium]|nr:hypothetical protein [Spirochaetaceae bacterium]